VNRRTLAFAVLAVLVTIAYVAMVLSTNDRDAARETTIEAPVFVSDGG